MELQAESERVKRSKILNSEGERQSKINVAEGYKQGRILEGQGKAEQISQEARSVVETLRNIGQSIKQQNGSLSEEALRLRLSEQYVKALHEVYQEGNIITLPTNDGAGQGSGISASTIATTFALYK
jgi:regulator of protease activity HflC (stomatin/prohibitin superfamily)